MKKTNNTYTFNEAYQMIPARDQKQVRESLKQIFGITTDSNIYARMRNKAYVPTYSQGVEVNALFAKYNMQIEWPK
jgi:hypothetical protein